MFFLYIVWLKSNMLGYSVAALAALIVVGIGITFFVDPSIST